MTYKMYNSFYTSGHLIEHTYNTFIGIHIYVYTHTYMSIHIYTTLIIYTQTHSKQAFIQAFVSNRHKCICSSPGSDSTAGELKLREP